MLTLNSSAIFCLVKKIDIEEAATKLKEYNGRILYSNNLSHENEDQLFQALSGK